MTWINIKSTVLLITAFFFFFFILFFTMDHVLSTCSKHSRSYFRFEFGNAGSSKELGHGGWRDRKRGWGVGEMGRARREFVDFAVG